MQPQVRSLTLVAALALGCASPPPVDADLVIDHVTLIDGTSAPPRTDMSVAVRGETIVFVAPTRQLRRLALDARRIDGRGKYLIPGLWDMHAHLYGYDEHAFPLFLANGITTIQIGRAHV